MDGRLTAGSIPVDTVPRILSASADCMKLLDLNGCLLFVNPAGCNALEVDTPSSLIGRRWTELWPPEAQAQVDQAIADGLCGKVARFTAFCPTAKGTPKWWDVSVSPLYDARGRVAALLSASRDVTEQRAVERWFRALADNMAQLAWMADASGAIFWFNRRWFDYTGIAPGSMAADGWYSAHHPEHVERVRARLSEAVAAGTPYEDTFPLRAADDSYGWFLFRAQPVHDEGGALQLWCATCTDITEQRSLGTRLRQMARLIELSHEAILARDIERGVVLWNKGCEELYGFTKAEAMGADSRALLGTVYPVPIAEVEERLQHEGTWTGALVQVHKNGATIAVDSRQELMRVDRRDITLETNRDVTARNEAEHIRELLIAELHHRVNNVLAIVQSIAAQTARNSASMEQFVGSFNARLLALSSTHNLLSSSNWVSADLRELISSQLAATLGDASAFDIDGPAVALPAQTAIQLGLVLCELASNARRHGSLTGHGGRVSIEWGLEGTGDKRRLRIVWREIGGPAVHPPERRRFGLTLIERAKSLPYLNLGLDFAPDGLVCRMIADLPETGRRDAYFAGVGSHRPRR